MRTSSFILGRSLVLGILLLLLYIPAWADTPFERSTLRGIKAIKVVVEKIDADAERDGLVGSQLQSDIELRLRQAGIPVDNHAPEFLYIVVNTIKDDLNLYGFSIRVEFRRPVHLGRDLSITTLGVTWSVTPLVGIVSSSDLRTLRDDVRDMVDEFIKAYPEKNPRQ